MIFFNPEQSIGNEEISYLVLAVVKYLGAPVGMFAESGIGMLIKACSVKLCKSVCILGEMCRYPV